MRITHLKIEHYGRWHDLSLPFDHAHLSILFGPNEAGKTTIMRFMRGLLFGFDDITCPAEARRCGGEITVEHNGETWFIQRLGGEFTISGPRNVSSAEADGLLTELLGGVTRETFEAVYCFGLEELQQLAVLRSDEIVEKLFGVSLGPDGRFVLETSHEIEARLHEIERGAAGRLPLPQLVSEHASVTRDLEEADRSRDRIRELRREVAATAEKIEGNQYRRDELQHELRGHQFLQRVHGPWLQAEELRERLGDVPRIDSFPERGLERLGELDHALDECRQQRDALRANLADLKQRAGESAVPKRFRHRASAVRTLLGQLDSLADTDAELHSLREELESLEIDIELRCDESHLRRTENGGFVEDGSPREIAQAALRFRAALRKRSLYRKRIEALSRRIQAAQDELQSHARHWQGQSAAQMVERTRRKIAAVRDRERLTRELESFTGRDADFAAQYDQLTSQEPLPKGVRLVLRGFVLFGVLLAGLGLWQGATVSGLAGAVFLLLGMTCGGLGIALNWHFAATYQDKLEQISASRSELAHKIEQTRSALNSSGGAAESSDDLVALAESLHVQQTLAEREAKLTADRHRASQWRARLQDLRRDVSRRRDEWCAALRRCGLTETLKLDDAMNQWNQRLELSRLDARRREIQHRVDDLSAARTVCERTMRGLEEEISEQPSHDSIDQIVDRWHGKLEACDGERRLRRELAEQFGHRREELQSVSRRRKELAGERAALLADAGAADREDFEQRARWYAERRELAELLDLAQQELRAAAETEPDLAVVEEDLRGYDEESSRSRALSLTHERDTLEAEHETLIERRGQLRQELDTRTADNREPILRQRQAELEEQILATAERYLGIKAAEQSVTAVRERLERENRPETLVRAEHYFQRLTRQRYQRLWAPLGERDLRVEDHTGAERRLAELSGGTREQLLLALRLAVVEAMRERGVMLPFLADDILVNFDHARVDAGVETLIEFSREHSQLLMFTCHRHLADAFRQHGIPVTDLPDRDEYRERLAG